MATRAFKNDVDRLFWAIEQQHTVLVEGIVLAKPHLVTRPSSVDKIPLYSAAQVGNPYVLLPLAVSPHFSQFSAALSRAILLLAL